MNLPANYVRLNEFPEWFVVDDNTLYLLTPETGAPLARLGAELVAGVELAPGAWRVQPMSRRPDGTFEQ